MTTLYQTIRKILVRTLEISVILLMGILVIDVTWQVVSRYILNKPSSWSEELARMLIIWVSLLGASVGFLYRSHLGVDYFVNKLPEESRSLVEFISHILVAVFALLVLICGGYQVVSRTLITNQLSPALQIKMGYVYLALPISGVCIMMFSLEAAYEKYIAFRKILKQTQEG